MNPSAEDMVKAITDRNADTVIVLPNNSNIIMTAQQAAAILEGKVDVVVLPSKTIPQGLSACVMFNPNEPIDAIITEMKQAIEAVKTGEVTLAIKDTTIDSIAIKAN